MKFFRTIDDAGFNLPELMTSTCLLALVATNTAQLYIRSQNSIQSTSHRDAAYALIAKDIEYLRAKAHKFGCEGLTDSGGAIVPPPSHDPSAASCTGFSRDASKPLMYKTARMPPISPYKDGCNLNLMAQKMVNAYSLPGNTVWATLNWTASGISSAQLPAGINTVSILRNIASSGNELVISYKTTTDSPIKLQLKTVMIPQAVGWCP